MSTLERARIVSASDVPPRTEAMITPETQRRIVREEVEGREAAAAIVAAAEDTARRIITQAESDARQAARAAADEARDAEHAKLAALYLSLRQADEERAERDLGYATEVAIALAERLLGDVLVRDPRRIVALAQQALAEARGARRAVIDASPLDADVLQHHLDEVGFPPHTVEVRPDPSLTRGSLRLSTNLGTLDAQLRPQLERLAAALRDALQRP